jgi:hypothetical protein
VGLGWVRSTHNRSVIPVKKECNECRLRVGKGRIVSVVVCFNIISSHLLALLIHSYYFI